jgi:hypothetical protein
MHVIVPAARAMALRHAPSYQGLFRLRPATAALKPHLECLLFAIYRFSRMPHILIYSVRIPIRLLLARLMFR